jgi:hypothetical protein
VLVRPMSMTSTAMLNLWPSAATAICGDGP